MEVEFITIGMASEHLKMNPATLRKWADFLEDNNTHYLHRNERDERVFNKEDIEVFDFMNNYKQEFGMKTQLKDLANMLEAKHDQDEQFNLRRKEEVPELERKHDVDVLKILKQDDIKNLMESDRIKQFIQIIMQGMGEELREEIKNEMREEFNLQKQAMQSMLEQQLKEIEESNERIETKMQKRDKKTVERLNRVMEDRNQSVWSRIFGGKKSEPIE